MRVVTIMELAMRCKIPYSRLKYMLDKGSISIKATIRIPYSGGYGFTIQQAAAIIKEITGEDLRDFK